MDRNQLINHANNLFVDRYSSLSDDEVELEIKKYSQGLAPFKPSFIVNQGNAHEKIKTLIKDFFEKQLGLEYQVLVSYIGDGKTHTLHFIHSHFSNIDNIFINKVYLRDKDSDIIQDILRTIKRSSLREIIKNIIEEAVQSEDTQCSVVSGFLVDKLDIKLHLAKLMWFVVYGDIEESVEALNFLSAQSNGLEVLKKKVGKIADYQSTYFEFLSILCDYFYKHDYFVILLFDELEHVFDRTERMKRSFFRSLKQLIDYSEKYRNLLVFFANTEAFKGQFNKVINDNLKIIDPALQDRLKSVLIPLNSLSSKDEALELINNLKIRYLRIYKNVKLDTNTVYSILINEKLSAAEPSYRTSCQKIIEIFNDIREKNLKDNKTVDNNISTNNISNNNIITTDDNIISNNKLVINKKESNDKDIRKEDFTNIKINILEKWDKSNSLTKKKLFINCFEQMFLNTDIKISDKKSKKGYMLAKSFSKESGRQFRSDRLYFFVYSDSQSDLPLIRKKLKEVEELQISLGLTNKEVYFIYFKEVCPVNAEEQLYKINPNIFIPIPVEKAELLELLLLITDDLELLEIDKKAIAYTYAKKFGIL